MHSILNDYWQSSWWKKYRCGHLTTEHCSVRCCLPGERAILKEVFFLLLLLLFAFFFFFYTLWPRYWQRLTHICLGRNQMHYVVEEQECKSAQKNIAVNRKTSIHKTHTRDNVSGKLSSEVKDKHGDTPDAHVTHVTSVVSLFLLRTFSFFACCCIWKKK